ncbi:type II and III secretion system protein family protein [Sphingobium sp. DEHP117]|uniref:type II and III secretion system protein family protein n=1 Tax=Sphingobium sp. DEHP117 TaxID=2993436 RepID=UPI0027D5BA0E|nr:pilus assembly protein N-terminal domain-containing protein [Sphingobium sp. DEHP117]MDQ4421088.1 type II and III secretion system protein family protein [Sphingobium sp. DEHP117]
MTNTRPSLRKAGTLASALLLASASLIAPAGIAGAAPEAAKSADSGVILMSVGTSRVINLPGQMTDVVVANPAVADVHVRSQNQIYILAKGAGETNISATTAGGRVLWSGLIRVGNNLTSIDQMLKLAMPDSDITVSKMNGLILLTGTVKAPEDAAEAERLVQAFSAPTAGGTPSVTVVSRLRTATPLQVNLQVKIAEVSRNLLHQIGNNIVTSDASGGFKFGVGQGRSFINGQWAPGGPLGVGNGLQPAQGYAIDPNTGLFRTAKEAIGSAVNPLSGATSIAADTKLFGINILAALDLAEVSGLATTLAQPNLTSLSGETASFLAGGEYPYQVFNGNNNGASYEFKQYGVQLSFTPVVLADGRISLRVRPTVSSLDFSVATSGVPALKTRTAETSVELGSGQSFMIAGLLSNDTSNNINKVPGIGNVPILGSLFKSRRFLRDETELVIVVTPYLVKPINASDVRLPTDGFRNATELQGLLLQKGSDGVSGGKRPMPSVAPSGQQPANPSGAPQAAATPAPAPSETKRKAARTASAEAVGPGFTF